MFHRRSGSPQRHLTWRTWLLGAGAALALGGMATEREWLVNVAIGVLIVGFGLRFIPEAGEEAPGGGEEDGDA